MSEEDHDSSIARARELVGNDPGRSVDSVRGLRGAVRRVLLRALRPYTYHQHRLDSEIVDAVQGLDERFESAAELQTERIERLEDLVRELIATAEALRGPASDALSEARDASGAAQRALAGLEALNAELNAPPYTAGSPFEVYGTPVGEVLGFRSRGGAGREDSDYAAFEDLFRGPTERVLESQLPYLALVADYQPVLDLGCGRGEFLALLAKEGVRASGVDGDAGMVARCRELGVDVVQGDINEHLEGLADGTLGTIFSAQVIEHLPYAQLQRMLELALAKLRPEGLLIAETVNPHRVSSLKTFWVDLTHQHPIFPEVALALCGIAGFESAYVFAPTFDSFERARLHSSAYAVVATSPAAPKDISQTPVIR